MLSPLPFSTLPLSPVSSLPFLFLSFSLPAIHLLSLLFSLYLRGTHGKIINKIRPGNKSSVEMVKRSAHVLIWITHPYRTDTVGAARTPDPPGGVHPVRADHLKDLMDLSQWPSPADPCYFECHKMAFLSSQALPDFNRCKCSPNALEYL